MNMNHSRSLEESVTPARVCLKAEAAKMVGGMLMGIQLEEWAIAASASHQAGHLLTAVDALGALRPALAEVDARAEAPFGNQPAPSTAYVQMPPDSRGRRAWRRPAAG